MATRAIQGALQRYFFGHTAYTLRPGTNTRQTTMLGKSHVQHRTSFVPLLVGTEHTKHNGFLVTKTVWFIPIF